MEDSACVSDFVYPSLQDARRQIRLMKFDLHAKGEALPCEIIVADIEKAPDYFALSYEWGPPSNLIAITINGMRAMVRQPCHYAMSQVHRIVVETQCAHLHFYRDALCINQADMAEMLAFCGGDSPDEGIITCGDPRLRVICDLDLFDEPVDVLEQASRNASYELWERVWAFAMNRTVFQTKDGRLGIGPVGIENGDSVVVLFSGSVPFVIGDRGYGDILIGPCFVRGVMKGEAVADIHIVNQMSEVFNLC